MEVFIMEKEFLGLVEESGKTIKMARYATYAKYAAAAVLVGVGGYYLYKGVKALEGIRDGIRQLSPEELKGAPNNQDVVDL
jgi:hypothetical protein